MENRKNVSSIIRRFENPYTNKEPENFSSVYIRKPISNVLNHLSGKRPIEEELGFRQVSAKDEDEDI